MEVTSETLRIIITEFITFSFAVHNLRGLPKLCAVEAHTFPYFLDHLVYEVEVKKFRIMKDQRTYLSRRYLHIA